MPELYGTSDERTVELPRWLHSYNWHRAHGSIGSKPTITCLASDRNNLFRLHSLPMANSSGLAV